MEVPASMWGEVVSGAQQGVGKGGGQRGGLLRSSTIDTQGSTTSQQSANRNVRQRRVLPRSSTIDTQGSNISQQSMRGRHVNGHRPHRKRSYEERESLFMEMNRYMNRHSPCGLCNAKKPRIDYCICVNDSGSQNIVDLGRQVLGSDRCMHCVRRGRVPLWLSDGVT